MSKQSILQCSSTRFWISNFKQFHVDATIPLCSLVSEMLCPGVTTILANVAQTTIMSHMLHTVLTSTSTTDQTLSRLMQEAITLLSLMKLEDYSCAGKVIKDSLGLDQQVMSWHLSTCLELPIKSLRLHAVKSILLFWRSKARFTLWDRIEKAS